MRACVLVLALWFAPARADDGLALAQRLTATARPDVERAVSDIERAPADTPYLEQALREAARACEDTLADPARALALYERIVAEFPDGAVATIARQRVPVLRARLGTGHQYAAEAAELAALSAAALPLGEVTRRAEALAAKPWPGAPDAMLVLAARLERDRRFEDALRRYAAIEARWPGTPQALAARRGGVEVAFAADDFARASELARGLPSVTKADRALRGATLDRIERGRSFGRWYLASWVFLICAVLGLAGSFAEAGKRAGWPRRALAPPVEAYFLLPIGVVLVAVALTTHAKIAPAVCTLSIGGIVLAWISGTTLELLRAARRAIGIRAAMQVVLCIVVIASLGCIALTRDGLLEIVIDTVQFGPE